MAETDWKTRATHLLKLYHTNEVENMEFLIDERFENPKFFTFVNGIRYNGTISGFIPNYQYIKHEVALHKKRYKLIPYIRTPFIAGFGQIIEAPATFTLPALPLTRRITFYGSLYPVGAMPKFGARVDIQTQTQTFPGVNMNATGTDCTLSYCFEYLVPEAYFQTGETLTYTSTGLGIASRTFYDLMYIFIESDYNLTITQDATHTITSSGIHYDIIQNGEFTILVTEGD